MKNKNLSKKIGCMVVVLLIFCISHLAAEPCGDVNSDGSIDIVDALLIAQYYVGSDPANFDEAAADVNGDGSIDILDALLVAQYYVGLIPELPGCEEPTPTPEGGTTTYELQAEDESWSSGGVDTNHDGYTGTGFVNPDNASGEWIEWSFDLSADSTAECVFRYACESDARAMDLSINGGAGTNLPFPASGAWNTWATQAADTVTLSAGSVTIRLTATTSGGPPNMDKMDITITGGVIVAPTATPAPTPTPVPTDLPPDWTPTPTPDPRLFKARVIATTDGETDDRSSMVRFLMYAGDYDIAGIVQVNGVQESGHSGDKWIEALLEEYDKVLPNLRVHKPDYPDTDYLYSVLKVGNENSGDRNSPPPEIDGREGAELIKNVLLDDDPRPVHILAWGGANTQANALWQIKEYGTAEEWQRAVDKARLYCIWYQDGGGSWIEDNLPEIKIFEAGAPERDGSWRYVWDYMSVDGKYKGRDSENPQALQDIMDTPWLMENVKQNHGPLCAAYNQDYTSEGDTPSFMPCVDNGLRQHMDYTLGGWGGRPEYEGSSNHMIDGEDDCYSSDSSLCNNGSSSRHYTFQRWLFAAQNDWASRADWCIASNYGDANHQPDAQVAGDLERSVAPGSTATLDASPSTDPDGNNLTFKWWQYHEADSASAQVTINNDTSQITSFVVPNESGKQVHIILEVKDDGTPNLIRYRRIIFNIN